MSKSQPKKEFWKLFGMYAAIAQRRCPRSRLHWLWVRARYYRAWKYYMTHSVSPLAARIPWIPFECIDYLKHLVKPGFHVFEYGSGGSTLFFASRVRKLVSVEHDPAWHAEVSRVIRDERLDHCDYRLLPPANRETRGVPDAPTFVTYTGDGFPGVTFTDYARSIEEFPDASLDMVSVDGRARNSCIFHAKPKVKPGGYLVLDNAERDDYAEGKAWMNDWPKVEFYGPAPWGEAFWQTIIWKRPL
jgi:hypothetical protein